MIKGLVFTGTKIIGQLIVEMVKDIYDITIVFSFNELKENLAKENFDFLIIDRTLKDCAAKDIFFQLIKDRIENIPSSILLTQEKYDSKIDGKGYSFILRKPFVKDEIIETINFVILEKYRKKLEKILIVDDSPTSRKILKKTLILNGFQCFEAKNGIDGLKKAKKIFPDLIIVDEVMPDISGIELAKIISCDEKLKKIPVILLSGSDKFNEIIERGFNSGISAYFRKPVDEEEIFNFFKNFFYSETSSKILVLDDSPTRRKAIYSNLSVNNNQVVTTSNIDKAIALLSDNFFNIVLIDLILKNETAFDAVRLIRDLNKEIPIIVYSSIGDRKNIYKVLELGASDFLWAPIEMRELILKVKIWLGYSNFNKLQTHLTKLQKKDNFNKDFMELVDGYLARDKLDGIISSLVCIYEHSLNIKKIIRKSDKIGIINDKTFIYFHNSNLINTLKLCNRIKLFLNKDVKLGISTSDEVNTVEDFFEKAERNIVRL